MLKKKETIGQKIQIIVWIYIKKKEKNNKTNQQQVSYTIYL